MKYALVSTAIVLVILSTSITSRLEAAQVRPLNLEELTARAATIVAGRCLESRIETDSVSGLPVTALTLSVDRWVRGGTGDTLVVRTTALGTSAEAATCAPGQEVVLFLYGANSRGITSPVGLGQGKFEVVTDKAGRKVAVNATGNRTLTRALSTDARAAVATWSEGGEGLVSPNVSPKMLLDAAEALGSIAGGRPR